MATSHVRGRGVWVDLPVVPGYRPSRARAGHVYQKPTEKGSLSGAPRRVPERAPGGSPRYPWALASPLLPIGPEW